MNPLLLADWPAVSHSILLRLDDHGLSYWVTVMFYLSCPAAFRRQKRSYLLPLPELSDVLASK